VYRFTDEYGYYSYTEKISKSFIDSLPDTFHPSMVQKQIDKQWELRIFFLEGQFYAMAIFSQETAATAVDNRKNFDANCLPRRVPYLLPEKIKRQLCKLMTKLKLNTGSIDMIVTKSNEYYFLEVNPIGQFGMVSQPCNYYLEKKIAKSL
jgi:glutathione synthase/RimK-type ligase-like ATP-grasp enzyme